MIIKYRGREIDLDVDGNSDSDDITLISADYVDTGDEVEDDVLDRVRVQFSDVIYEDWFQQQVGKADDARDAARDREMFGE